MDCILPCSHLCASLISISRRGLERVESNGPGKLKTCVFISESPPSELLLVKGWGQAQDPGTLA